MAQVIKLDLGCGPHRRPGYIGLDFKKIKNLDIIGDAHNLPVRDDVFIEIISSKVFEHLNNPSQCLVECRRVLREGVGVLKLGIPNIHSLRRFLRWAIKGKITTARGHIFCWGLPEIIHIAEGRGFTFIEYDLDTYSRYHRFGMIERTIRMFNNRIVDKNLNLVFKVKSFEM